MPSTDPDAFDSSPGDLLTVIEFDAFQTMAGLQVLQCHISDERAVVQLHHREALLATGTAAQSSDAIICDELAVWQRLSEEQQTKSERDIQGLIFHMSAVACTRPERHV